MGTILCLWTMAIEKRAHYTPDYPMKNLEVYLEKKELTEKEYVLLFCQTGLGKAAVDELRKRGDNGKLSKLQQDFFRETQVYCEPNTVISREEVLLCDSDDLLAEIPVVEDGDILVTFNCHVLGWRVGHAGIVVDAENRMTLEARVLGSDSAVLSLEHWRSYPSFAVLRLREVSKEERKEIAEYAAAHLADVPYQLTAGILSMPMQSEAVKSASTKVESTESVVLNQEIEETKTAKTGSEEAITGTQCAHLVWYAYKHFGYDLDSNGGVIVTPQDLFDSPLLEVVQIYGMDVRKLKFYKEY